MQVQIQRQQLDLQLGELEVEGVTLMRRSSMDMFGVWISYSYCEKWNSSTDSELGFVWLKISMKKRERIPIVINNIISGIMPNYSYWYG